MTRHLLQLYPSLLAAFAIAALAACNEELPFPPTDGGTDAVSDSGGDTGTDTGTCTDGETRPADDGCNTCTCTDAGEWACTERACASECDSDDDCIRTGCSGQLCRPEPTASTCEFLPHYACFGDPEVTSCGCRSGVCAWDPTDALSACIADAGAP